MTAAVSASPVVDQLETALTAAVAAEDWDLVDALSADVEALEDGADPADLARLDEVAALIEAGASEFDACTAVYGRPAAERLQRQEAVRRLRQQYTGRGFDELARQSYRDRVEDAWLAAEEACRGHLVNRVGRAAGVDGRSLFTGPLPRAVKYASDELIEWWETNGRVTFDEWREQLLTGTCTAATRFRGSGRALERRGHGTDQTGLPKPSIPRKDTPTMTTAFTNTDRAVVIDPDTYDGRQHGAGVLDDCRHFLSRFVTFPSQAVLDTVALWIAHTHVVDGNDRLAFDTTPRIAFISDEPASGKSTALQMVCELAHKGQILIDVTHPSFAEEMHENQATIGIDEMDVLFGNGAAKRVLRSLLNGGYKRKTAWWTRAGKDKRCIFGPVAFAGLGAKWKASDDLRALRTRTIQITMAPGPEPETYRDREHDTIAARQRKVLGKWSARHAPEIITSWPDMPEGIQNRDRELWEPLIAVADTAGGHWPESARAACLELALGNQDNAPEEPSLREQLLADLRVIFGSEDRLPTARIIRRLYDLPEGQWRDLWSNEANAPRELSATLGDEVAPVKVRDGERTFQGYARKHLAPLWADVPERSRPRVPGVPDVLDED
jgi:hypothetical protein